MYILGVEFKDWWPKLIGPIGRVVGGLKKLRDSLWLSQCPTETDLPSSLYQSLNECFSCREKKDIQSTPQ